MTEGIREIVHTLFEAMLLVILVVFIFLQNWRATLIPLIAVPVSLIGTFAVFPLLGFSINTLSLFAFVLAIGLVVDDAIVVVEAVEQHIERGLAPRQADPGDAGGLRAGGRHRADPVVGLPAGRLHGRHSGTAEQSVRRDDCGLDAHFGLQRVDACRRRLPPSCCGRATLGGLLGRFFGGFRFEKVMRGYVDGSHFLMRKVVVGILILAGFYIVDGLIGRKLPTSFLPEEDYGYFFMNVQLPAAASLARTDQVLHKIEGMLSKTEGVKDYNTISGFSLLTRISASYQGFFFVSLKPWDERTSPQVTARPLLIV